MNEDESALIALAQRGDLDAFNALVLRYQDSAYTRAYRLMNEPAAAADLTQDAMLTAYRRLNTYRGGSFRSWLLRIVTNLCYDALRRDKRHPVVGIDDLSQAEGGEEAWLPASANTPEQDIQQRELLRAIEGCIHALPPDQRVALILCDVDGLNYQTIADQLNASLGTVKSRISRARASVRACLQAFKELLPSAFRLKDDAD
ncbi:MAG: sigma-70 family RNA polymerase sigma factor [Aggregatilineales bacterium]